MAPSPTQAESPGFRVPCRKGVIETPGHPHPCWPHGCWRAGPDVLEHPHGGCGLYRLALLLVSHRRTDPGLAGIAGALLSPPSQNPKGFPMTYTDSLSLATQRALDWSGQTED